MIYEGFRYRTNATPCRCFNVVAKISGNFCTVETVYPNGARPSKTMPIQALEDYLYRPNIGLSVLFPDYERVIVTGVWRGGATQEVGHVLDYDGTTGKYWVKFRDGHGDGNSWHTPDELAPVPGWVRNGARVYSATGWRAGQPFTITNAAAEVVTLTANDDFAFPVDIVELLEGFTLSENFCK